MTTVLVIEDMDELREEIMELLSYEGFTVITAPNGKKGVELAKLQLPDVILCDIAMPELDGYQVLSLLREYAPTAATPFIFLTAKVSKADMRLGMDMGADDYLTKPFTAQELINAITARLQKNQRLRQNAEEQFTHLPSALGFNDQLSQAMADYRHFCLLFVDIDHFQLINNTLGYTIGDQLFQGVAQRLQRAEDATVARLRGDEFAVVIPHIHSVPDAHHAGEELAQSLREPFRLYDQEIFLTASVGIALYPRHGDTVESLIKCADLALYAAKQKGGNTHFIFSPDLSARSSEYLALANSLLRAVERQEFCVYYQPIFYADTNKIYGVEALVRWQHPKLGLVPPTKFIPIAEELGVIRALGEAVLSRALRDFDQLDYRVAVNVSARQLAREIQLVGFLEGLVRGWGRGGEQLELEITESTFISQRDEVIGVLNQIRQLGVQVAIDDFGTGYSSLSFLHNLPINSLKIDGSFVQNLEHSNHDRIIVQTILNLAHALNLQVTAEGVENQAQLEFLQAHGCDRLQGYLFTPPLPLAQFHEYCRSQPT